MIAKVFATLRPTEEQRKEGVTEKLIVDGITVVADTDLGLIFQAGVKSAATLPKDLDLSRLNIALQKIPTT